MATYPNGSKKSAAMTGKTKVTKGNAGHNGFSKGGSTKMFGKQHAGPQVAGDTSGDKAGSGGKFAKGGSGKMFGKQSAAPKASGVTGKVTK